MSSNEKRVRTSKRNFILALILLLITNILMGLILTLLFKSTLREQIEQRMLDVANTAAYQLDGDVLKRLKPEDKGTEDYERVLQVLASFQENIELDYIYGINAEPDGSFTFTVDPDPVIPGEFGSPIEGTPALRNAANGKADIDRVPHTDQWGRFYSTYSPVFDSDGNVAGIVGVDFNAEIYDAKLNSHILVVAVLTVFAMIVGVILSFFIMSQNQKRFTAIMNSVSELDDETKKLDNIILQTSIKKLDMLPESENEVLKTLASGESGKKIVHNEYKEVSTSINRVCNKLRTYLNYLDSEIYTDAVTGVNNKAAYKLKLIELNDRINAGYANFSVLFFDINGIKQVYAHFGFEDGDKLMFICAKVLKSVFDKNSVFHVTGDEFIVILDAKSKEEITEYFNKIEDQLKAYNDESIKNIRISVAKGYAIFDFEKHKNYRDVFVDAHNDCERDKAVYYAEKKSEHKITESKDR